MTFVPDGRVQRSFSEVTCRMSCMHICSCIYLHVYTPFVMHIFIRHMPGVTGYLAPQEIQHPRTIFPRNIGIPPGNLEPPSKSGNIASWILNFLGYLVPHAKNPRIFVDLT